MTVLWARAGGGFGSVAGVGMEPNPPLAGPRTGRRWVRLGCRRADRAQSTAHPADRDGGAR